MIVSTSIRAEEGDLTTRARSIVDEGQSLPRIHVSGQNYFLSLSWAAAEQLIKDLTSTMNNYTYAKKPS